MSRKYLIRGRWLVIFVIFAVLFGAYFVAEYIINEPAALAQKAIVEKQANQLVHPQGVQQIQVVSGNKTTSAFVTEVFTTALDFETLRAFYDSEFQRLGFTLAKTDITNTPDYDMVRATVSFCKRDYTARLRYKGLTHTGYKKDDEWSYAIDLSWWNRGCEP